MVTALLILTYHNQYTPISMKVAPVKHDQWWMIHVSWLVVGTAGYVTWIMHHVSFSLAFPQTSFGFVCHANEPQWTSTGRLHFHRSNLNWNRCICIIDQTWGQDDRILAKFLFAFLCAEIKSRSIKMQNITRPMLSALLTEQAWSSLTGNRKT